MALGACTVERYIMLDRAVWGSDQVASVEPQGFSRLARDIRLVETAIGDGVKRVIEREVAIMKKLRRIDSKSSGL
jgi:sialic acid synthase SpsE